MMEIEMKTGKEREKTDLLSAQASATPVQIRFYRPEDRAAVRRICADTGFLGKPIDPIFEDRELFADYLTEYYTDQEPESTLVVENKGRVLGYLMGSRLLRSYQLFRYGQALRLLSSGVYRYFTWPYQASTRRYIHWILTQAGKQSPYTPPDMPHFHINVLPEARSVANVRRLINQFLRYLYQAGEKAVYGQMVTFDQRRGSAMFRRYGFNVVDQVEVTKYRWLDPQTVFLFTVVKDLTRHPLLGQADSLSTVQRE